MNATTAFWHLLWKDFRQARAALLGCLLMLACVQLWCLAIELLDERNYTALYHHAYLTALVAPTLVAMACSGLLIGQERQTRTWNWSSSLPVTWYSALASKFVLWLLASVVSTALLLLFFGLLVRIAVLAGPEVEPPEWGVGADQLAVYLMLFLIPFEVFTVFSIAALLWNDTLLAFVIAAFAVACGHILLVDPAVRAIHGIPWSVPMYARTHIGTAAALLVTAIILASMVLAYTFRWRWTTGQLASLSLGALVRAGSTMARRQQSVGSAPSDGVSRRSVYVARLLTKPGARSETAVMLQHAWRSGLGGRLAILISAVGLLLVVPGAVPIYPVIIMATSFLLGASVFGGEQSLGRYRFFADRGASWVTFLISHVLFGVLWLVALLAAVYAIVSMRPEVVEAGGWEWIVLAFLAFGSAAFAALCVTNSVIAITLAAVSMFSLFAGCVLVHSYWLTATGQETYMYVAVPIAVGILLFALLYQTRRWFIRERSRALPVWLGAWVLAWAVPAWGVLTFGFLTIPRVPWQGGAWPSVPARQIDALANRKLPSFTTELNESVASVALPPVPLQLVVAEYRYATNYKSALSRIEEHYGGVERWLGRIGIALEQIERELAQGERGDLTDRTLFLYTHWIEQSAVAAVAATQARDSESAIRAWRVNHSLLALGEGDLDLATRSVAARTTTWGMWSVLTPDDWKFLNSATELRDLLPGRIDNAEWALALKQRWSARILALRDDRMPRVLSPLSPNEGGMQVDDFGVFRSAFKYYPPLRWATERIMALRLAEELAMLEHGTLLSHFPERYRSVAHDPLAFELERLNQLQRQITAKVVAAQ